MNCYLCGMTVRDLDAHHNGEHLDCPDCGEYTISGVVRRELSAREIDYPRMREDMHRQRQANATSVAHIDSESVIWKA